MKKYSAAIIALFCGLLSVDILFAAANTWTQKTDFGGTARHQPVSFSIGSKGYLGTGSGTKDFWEYDPVADTWTQKADFAGTARSAAVGFSIGNKGYIGTGRDYTIGTLCTRDFWEYDPVANIWTQKADFGGTAREEAVGFSIGSKGYLGTGAVIVGSAYYRDFWEYDPVANAWTRKADFGGTARCAAVGFSIGTKAYLGSGYNGSSYFLDFLEYDPAADTWTTKANFAGTGRSHAVGLSTGSKGYIGTGYGNGFKTDFWEYDAVADAWAQKADFGGLGRSYATGFSIGDKGYIGAGYGYGAILFKDFWEYESTDTTPDPFTFTDQIDVALSTVITSNTITVAGINIPAPISIAGGTYAINGGSYTSASGVVSNADTVTVQQTSSGSSSTTTDATLTIGGVPDTFSVTTLPLIQATITVTAPNGGESWVLGSTHDITWGSTGAIANAKIEYSINNGTDWTSITASTANNGSYAWIVPYAASSQCLVRVSDAANASVYDVSNAVFNIASDVTEPNGTSATAGVLPMGTTDNLVFDGGALQDIDWYKFFVPAEAAGQDLKVNVRVTSPYPDPIPSNWRSDIDFELLNGTLGVRGITMSGSDNETLYLPDVASGWYYIYIGYCTTDYPDSPDHARYAVSLETGTDFGLGYLSGRVVDGVGQGIEKVFLTLYHNPGDWNTCFPAMTTGAGGYFTVAFPPGTYDLNFAGMAGGRTDGCKNQAPINVVAEYYNDKKAVSLADHIGLAAGQTQNLGNVALGVGAIVTGHVTDGGGNPLANIFVGSYDAQGYSADNMALTNAAGDYSLSGVPIGGAKIRFWRGGFAHEYYNDKPTFGSGEFLATRSGLTIPDINAQLTTGGSISGNVSDGQGTGLTVNVRLYSVLDDTFARAGVSSVTGSGDFNFNNVMPGDYKIFFNAAGTAYAAEWHSDAASFAQATVITVTEGSATTGIDAHLSAPVTSVCCGVGDTAGLISYWKFDETVETTAADTFSGYTGTLTYASPAITLPAFTAGKVTNALSLSNGQYVTVPSNAALNITGDLTIALWIKPDSIACSGLDAAYVLVSKRDANPKPTPYEFMIGCGGSLRYEAWPGQQPYAHAGTDAGLVAAGVWQHVAMTRSYSGTIATVTFYVNGVPVGSSSQDIGPTVASSDPVWIARDGYHTLYTTQGSFSGLMDEVAIFNRALSPSEMANIYEFDQCRRSLLSM